MHPALGQLTQLPVAERLEIVHELWDSIAESKEQLSAEQWHREIATARLAELEGREEEEGLTREQVWEQVDQRRGS
ncbi:MAG: addiction module protein [Lacipirellulaceae bacterium]